MIGDTYWSTGISVRYGYAAQGRQGWSASLTYLDAGFCNDDPGNGVISTEGTLRTRYVVPESDDTDVLAAVIDALKADAERLGIDFRGGGGSPRLYYEGDGENPEWPPPEGWRRMLAGQSARLGWEPLYDVTDPDDVDCGLADETLNQSRRPRGETSARDTPRDCRPGKEPGNDHDRPRRRRAGMAERVQRGRLRR